MIKEKVTPQETIDFLNSLLKIDPISIGNIFRFRVPCNLDLADHPTVQVGCEGPENNFCQVGMVGILNGLFGTNKKGWGCISIDMDNGIVTGFKLLDDI